MREFDFDELDKAVSSLMNKNQKNTEDQPSDKTSSSDPITVDAPVVSIPSDDDVSADTDTAQAELPETKESPVAEESADSSVEETTSLESADSQTADASVDKPEDTADSLPRSVPHRAGNFMDVKHDSSNMRTATPTTGRHGITIQPMASSPADQPEETSQLETTEAPDETEMPVSPFLTDAKVEKRPLGRPGKALKASQSDDEPSKSDTPDEAPADDTEESAPTSPSEPIELPEELQPDLVSIESDIDTTGTEPDETATVKTDQPPKVDLSKELQPATDDAPESEPSQDSKPTGPVSIPQQYKESPSSQPQDSGTIYDTENYHQPITHPAKKSSGWTIVIWIVLIIILGCALGVAAYFSGLI